ncbi:NAD-dependent epimerase/dehydratase family protein [Palleronia abyssalis]|nr:NAD-dependent epimerase/dehydratase family protein [Palleronia abyssalis]
MTTIYMAGHEGMVGRAILRRLEERRMGGEEITCLTRERDALDLREQAAVRHFLQETRPDVIIMAAGRSGGPAVRATAPADFIYDTLMMEANVIHEARSAGVQRMVRFVPAGIYPAGEEGPAQESRSLIDMLSASSDPHATAKATGTKLCDYCNRQAGTDYRTMVTADLYGPGGDFDSETGDLPLAFLHRFHTARNAGQDQVAIGESDALGSFLHVDDLADGALFVLDLPKAEYTAAAGHGYLNIGSEHAISVSDLAVLASRVTGYSGRIVRDPARRETRPSRVLDAGLLARLGWSPSIGLADGLAASYDWFFDARG